MRKLERKAYETADELEARLKLQEAALENLAGEDRQAAMIQLSMLRNYAQAKRWLEKR